jgi:hypothetical protein
MRRLLVLGCLTFLLLCQFAAPASAHDPIFLTSQHERAETGPFLPDGTISFAFYGDLGSEKETRGFQAEFQEGQTLQISMLIPAALPETNLQFDDLPVLKVTRPDGTSFDLAAEMSVEFYEPYTGTSYVRVNEFREVAQEGIHDFLLNGNFAARFVVSIGAIEQFGTPVKRYARPFSLGSGSDPLTQWFSNAPEQINETDERLSVNENTTNDKSELIEIEEAVPESDDSESTRNLVVPLTLGIAFTSFTVWRATRRFKRLQKTAG